MKDAINKILERDRVFGEICQEAEISYKNENYFSAIACLFIVAEQTIKHLLNKKNGNFYKLLTEAREIKKISESEFALIDILRDFRNKLFHENHYSLGIEIKGKLFPVDEKETKKIIYEQFAGSVFEIVLRITKES
ncbi:MAG: hypothetical protein V3S42_05180 [Candidatus Neomarinimicrobiota bacterium]